MKIALRLSALTVAAVALAGCSGGGDTSYGAIAGDLTPELQGTVERPIDVDRHMVFVHNHNLRMLSDDWQRFWYTDHPSRLSPYPIMYTSGMPR
jgi:hypothetical protein